MAGNGTPQSYLNGIIQRNNNGQIRDRAMEQDNTNSGNPYGYIPQLPDQQVPSSYPSNRYIPPTMTGVNGSWNNTGLTYSLPTAYIPYGQGGTPYGPQMPTPWMPSFYHGILGGAPGVGGAGAPPGGQMPVGPQSTAPGQTGPQPMQAAGSMGKPGVAGGTFQQPPTQVGPTAGTNPITRNRYRDRPSQPAGDFYKGHIPRITPPYNPAQSPATNDLNNAIGNMQFSLGAQQQQNQQNFGYNSGLGSLNNPAQGQFNSPFQNVPPQQLPPSYTGGGGPGLGPQQYNPLQLPQFNSPVVSWPIGNQII